MRPPTWPRRLGLWPLPHSFSRSRVPTSWQTPHPTQLSPLGLCFRVLGALRLTGVPLSHSRACGTPVAERGTEGNAFAADTRLAPARGCDELLVRSDRGPDRHRPSLVLLSTIDLTPGDARGMSRWRKALFVATSRITADAAEYFGLPRERS